MQVTAKALKAVDSLVVKLTLISMLVMSQNMLKTMELGWKSTLQDGRMILNGAIFKSEYDDKQESILIPVDLTNVATVVRNAASMEMMG